MIRKRIYVQLALIAGLLVSCHGAINPTLRAATLEQHRSKHDWKSQMGIRVFLDGESIAPASLQSGKVTASVDYCLLGTSLAGTRVVESWTVYKEGELVVSPDEKVYNSRQEETYNASNEMIISEGTTPGNYEFVCIVSATMVDDEIEVRLPFTVTE